MDGLYGLELTRNSKVGWAFSVSRKESCIGATEACRTLCYGNGVRYKTKGARRKRERNFRTVERLLALGGPELLADPGGLDAPGSCLIQIHPQKGCLHHNKPNSPSPLSASSACLSCRYKRALKSQAADHHTI